MKFIAFALIALSSVDVPTFAWRNSQNPPDMEHQSRQFGQSSLINQQNRNCNIQAGNTCYGSIIGNRNSEVQCEGSSVEFSDNRNTRAGLSRSTVKISNQSNTKVSATSSTLEMTSDNNMDVQAENAWCKFVDNRNLDYQGSGGFNEFLSQFVRNRSAKITGTNNRVVAIDNRNMKVEGNDNRLDISNTRNHNVRPAPAGSSKNTLTITKDYRDNQHFVFNVEYVGSAFINGPQYRLGNIQLDAAEIDDMVRVTLQQGSGSVLSTTFNNVVVQSTTQTLEVNGGRVEVVGSNSFNIYSY